MTRFPVLEPRLSIREVAQLLGVSVATIWRWVLAGVRGRRYVLESDLEKFLQPHEDQSDASADCTNAARIATQLDADDL